MMIKASRRILNTLDILYYAFTVQRNVSHLGQHGSNQCKYRFVRVDDVLLVKVNI